MKLCLYLMPHMKINSRWIKDLNVQGKIIKLLEDNIRDYLYKPGLGLVFLNKTQKPQELYRQSDKLNFIKTNNLSSTFTIKIVKGHATNQEKIFVKYITREMGNGKENRLLTEEEIQMANENMAFIKIPHYWVTQEQITVTIHLLPLNGQKIIIIRYNQVLVKGCTIYIYIYTYTHCMFGEGNGTPLQYSCLANPMEGLVGCSPWGC